MFFPLHGQSKAISTMVTPPPFGLPMAHPPWSGADCYQWLCFYKGEAVGAVGVGIGHTHHCHGSSPMFGKRLTPLLRRNQYVSLLLRHQNHHGHLHFIKTSTIEPILRL